MSPKKKSKKIAATRTIADLQRCLDAADRQLAETTRGNLQVVQQLQQQLALAQAKYAAYRDGIDAAIKLHENRATSTSSAKVPCSCCGFVR